MSPTVRRSLIGALLVLLLGYAAIHAMIWRHGLRLLDHPPQRAADAAGQTGIGPAVAVRPVAQDQRRVDAGIALANAGFVRSLVLSGGIDREDGRIEAEVMERHARVSGYRGPLLLEPVSSSTRENLSMSRDLLKAAGVKSVIIVTEPYHLWRAERLARASGFDRAFDVQYAAAPTSCWERWGMAFKGALREPLAIANNARYF